MTDSYPKLQRLRLSPAAFTSLRLAIATTLRTSTKATGPAILILALILIGCTHTEAVWPTDYDRINAQIASQPAIVHLDFGKQYSTKALELSADTTTWLDPATSVQMSVPTSWVTTVSVAQPGHGALKGLGIGVTAGALTGALIGVASHEPNLAIDKGFAALVGAAVFGGAGLVIGPIVGSLTRKDVYQLLPSELSSSGHDASVLDKNEQDL